MEDNLKNCVQSFYCVECSAHVYVTSEYSISKIYYEVFEEHCGVFNWYTH